jgi:adenosylmethionine-8-amino-7-oxononanoate aminotransferase
MVLIGLLNGKKKVCFTNGFHGRTFGALSVTNQPKYQLPFAPLVPGIRPGDLNDINALPELITSNTCGVIVEPIQVSSISAHLARSTLLKTGEVFLLGRRWYLRSVGGFFARLETPMP